MTNITHNVTDEGSTQAPADHSPALIDRGLLSQAATAEDIGRSDGWASGEGIPAGQEERKRLGWGEKYVPPIEGREERRQFAQICQRVLSELDALRDAQYVMDGRVADEGAGVVAEITNLLESLFDCPFGEGESLKSTVVAIQSQTNNADWSQEIVDFLREAMGFLQARYVVNEQTVDEVYEIMREHALDPFRGSVSDRGIKTRYRLVKDDR